MGKIIRSAREHNLVIHIHTGSNQADASHMDEFIPKYGKGLKIQFVHMGGSMSGHLSFIPRFVKWINEGYDFYADTSHSRGYALKWCLKLAEGNPFLLKRILFASDNPWGDFGQELSKIEGLDCSMKIKEDILYTNAMNLYSKLLIKQ